MVSDSICVVVAVAFVIHTQAEKKCKILFEEIKELTKNIWLYMAIILKILNFSILVYQFDTFPIKMPIRLYET